jgi:hypothetical protein
MRKKVMMFCLLVLTVVFIMACDGGDSDSSSSTPTHTSSGSNVSDSSGGSNGDSGDSGYYVDVNDENSYSSVAVENSDKQLTGLWLGKIKGYKDGEYFEKNVTFTVYSRIDYYLSYYSKTFAVYAAALRTSFFEALTGFTLAIINGKETFLDSSVTNEIIFDAYPVVMVNGEPTYPNYFGDKFLMKGTIELDEENMNHMVLNIENDDNTNTHSSYNVPFILKDVTVDLYLKWPDYPAENAHIQQNGQEVTVYIEKNKISEKVNNILGSVISSKGTFVFEYDESINAIILNGEDIIVENIKKPENFKVIQLNDDIWIYYEVDGEIFERNMNSDWKIYNKK